MTWWVQWGNCLIFGKNIWKAKNQKFDKKRLDGNKLEKSYPLMPSKATSHS